MQKQSKRIFETKNSPKKDDRWRDFYAALLGGFISVTLCNPLDIIRTRLNIMSSPNHQSSKYSSFFGTMKMIWKQQGWRGFYLGYRTTVIGVPLFNSLFFPIYQQSKQYFQRQGYSKTSIYCLSSLIAGSVCNVLTNPIWVVRTRIMVQFLHPQHSQYIETNPTKVIRQIYHDQGFKALFKGLVPSMLSISNAIIYFLLYEQIKSRILQKQAFVNSYYIFLAATFAKIISSTITYPLVVIRTIFHDHRSEQKLRVLKLLKHMYEQRGIRRGFFGGLKPDLMRIVPSNAILFVVYEYMKRIM